MRFVYSLYLLCSFSLFVSCEELIDINLNDADPRYVIEAQLTDLTVIQQIRVSQTVAFNASENSLPISAAEVRVHDGTGAYYAFTHIGNGLYEQRSMRLMAGRTYTLQVDIDGEQFVSSQRMPSYVEVDSMGIVEENILNENYYFPTFKFEDPKGIPNYYKYDMATNGSDFKFAMVFNDKFNDGLFVTHQVADFDNELSEGSVVLVRRYCIDKSVYNYWNEFQSTNPGTAAPGNPTSNISNGALGYFSVSSAKEYTFNIPFTE